MRINRRISPTDASYPTGMMFFPTKMMEGYKAGTFKGDGNTFFLFAMGIFGLSIMGAMVSNATMRLPSASKKAQGVQCLANCMSCCGHQLCNSLTECGPKQRGENVLRCEATLTSFVWIIPRSTVSYRDPYKCFCATDTKYSSFWFSKYVYVCLSCIF